MKKALMVLGFAMCTTFAFAQTMVHPGDKARMSADKIPTNDLPREAVDYKASIFAKDATLDTLRRFSFNATDWAEITLGNISSSDHINVDGQDSTFGSDAHSVNTATNSWAQWRRYADTATLKANFANDYPTWIARFFFGRETSTGVVIDDFSWVFNRMNAIGDDGLVVFGYDNNNDQPSVGKVNTYMEFPAVSREASASHHMFLVAVTQIYYSFYDQCFVDYQIGNTWYTREINVNGVDCDVNSLAAYQRRYVMPYNLVDQTTLKMRIRVSGQKYAAYGYAWFLDDVAVVNDLRTESWDFSTLSPFGGFEGMIPQGMTIPMTYGVHVRNTNINALNNAKLVVTNRAENGEWSEVASGDGWTIPAGEPQKDYKLWINERGFLCTSSHEDTLFDWGAHSFLGRFANYGNQGSLIGGYQGRHLNTETAGANYYALKAVANNGSVVRELDTVLYTVSSPFEFEANEPNRVDGYRWGRDNGLIPSNSIFKVGFTDNHYLDADDDSNHVFEAGYTVFVRYVTGSDVPDNYVFRGFELVPHTTFDNPINMVTEDGVIYPIIYEEVPDENGDLDWVDLPCGIDNQLFAVTEDAVNNLPTTYALPSTESNYSAVNIKFLDEPRLKKNTSYLFGYQLNEDAQFAVARQATRYRDGNSWVNYSANENTAAYARQNYPIMPYDVIVYDNSGTSSSGSHWILGWNIDYFPMIRPIVGTPSPVQTVTVVANNCTSDNMDTLGVTVTRGTTNLCEEEVDVTVGSNQSFSITPIGEHTVIREGSIKVNGVEAPVYVSGGETPEGNFWLYENEYNVDDHITDGNVILYRSRYTLFIQGIENSDQPYVITAEYDWEPWDLTGIDPVAPEVRFGLAPNPATSSVKLNIAGVTGMVNCSIIDMSGRVVYNANVNAEAETMINVSNMPAGAYFVRITNNTFSKVEKLIIK